MRKLFLALGVLMTLQQAVAQPIFMDESKSFEERTANLISLMTLDEKISQMVNDAEAIPRLGIPEYSWWNECLHGLARAGKSTVFPQSIGLGASFDPELIHRMADAISDEARAFYGEAFRRGNTGQYVGLTYYSPNVNIFRDPRWGRGQETYGEDPYLTSRMGVEFVRGLQGNDPKYLKTAACAKHYAVHSGPEKLRHVFDAVVSDRDLYETYLPAFKALVQEAEVKSVMGAYNRTNGEACCASPFLLQDILVKQWGFNGYLTSDCGALNDIFRNHKLCKTPTEAAAMAAKAGMNLNCGSLYSRALGQAVQKGLVTEELVDSLLFPLMLTRFQLGLFDDPAKVPFNKVNTDIVDSQLHQDLAYETALKSLVLLENKNNTLPLPENIRRIYVTGPNANNADALIGNYFGVSDRLTTYLEGIVNRAPAGVSVQYKQGALLAHDKSCDMDWASGGARDADVTIACLGLTWLLEGEEGEAIASSQKGDLMDNSIPEPQMLYLRKLHEKCRANGNKLVVVISGGAPLDMREVRELCDALIYAWYPGEAGGSALADVLFGNANPSGRCPVTFVKSLDQLPPYEDYSMAGRTYRYMTEAPLYPFGYGLSYSKFSYAELKLPSIIKAGETLELEVTVANDSDHAGEEVVQVYITDENASVPVPIRQLAAFTRVFLAPGETKILSLEIAPEKMSLITDKTERKIEKGYFTVSVGGGQPLPQTDSYVQGRFKVKNDRFIEL